MNVGPGAGYPPIYTTSGVRHWIHWCFGALMYEINAIDFNNKAARFHLWFNIIGSSFHVWFN